jgi:hypothetical protein
MSGAYDGFTAASTRTETGLIALIAFVVELVGLVFLLLVPGLRWLVLIPAMVAFVPWFFASRDVSDDFLSQTAFWPAMLAGAAAVAYAARKLVSERPAVRRLAARMRDRAASLARRGGNARPAQP